MLLKMVLCFSLAKPSCVPSVTILVEPPKKLTRSYYRCDNKFHLDIILDMYENEEKIGVCLMSGKELMIYVVTLSGKHIDYKLVKKLDIHLANKHNKGGSSSGRFGRIIQKVRENYVGVIVECILELFVEEDGVNCSVKHIIVGGPSQMKNDVVDVPEFKQYIGKYLFKTVTTNSITDRTIYDIIDGVIDEIRVVDVKEVEDEINQLMTLNFDMIAFGNQELVELLDTKNITKLFINKSALNNPIFNEIKTAIETKINKDVTEIIITESDILKTYGGFVAVKKY